MEIALSLFGDDGLNGIKFNRKNLILSLLYILLIYIYTYILIVIKKFNLFERCKNINCNDF